jgi:hypothetical protein
MVIAFTAGNFRFTYSTHLGVMCQHQPAAKQRELAMLEYPGERKTQYDGKPTQYRSKAISSGVGDGSHFRQMTTDKPWVGRCGMRDAAGCSCAYFRRVYALSNSIRMFGL